MVHDPVLTLLCCENKAWICVGEVNAIKVNGATVDKVPARLRIEDYVSVSFQLLGLCSSNQEDDPSGEYDWRTCSFLEMTLTVHGQFTKAIDPVTASLPANPSKLFYLLDSGFVTTLGASLYSRLLVPDIKIVPKVSLSKDFPYCELGGESSFFSYILYFVTNNLNRKGVLPL